MSIVKLTDKQIAVKQAKETLDTLKVQRQLKQEINYKQNTLSSNVDDFLTAEDDPKEILQKQIEKIQQVQNKLPLINEKLSKLVVFTSNQLYLIGAQTGKGKSSTVANIAATLIKIGKKPLIIANEEREDDVYTRVACLLENVSYGTYTRGLASAQANLQINERIQSITSQMKVIGLTFKNNPKYVTTLSGLRAILNTKDIHKYDAVLIDYYQKVSTDTEVPTMDLNEVQNQFSFLLDKFKNEFNGPVVLLSQLHPVSKEDKGWNVNRIKGRKTIADVATYILEIQADKNNYESIWLCHKDRFFDKDGSGVRLGYDRDTSAMIDPDQDPKWNEKVTQWKLEKAQQGLDQLLGSEEQ